MPPRWVSAGNDVGGGGGEAKAEDEEDPTEEDVARSTATGEPTVITSMRESGDGGESNVGRLAG